MKDKKQKVVSEETREQKEARWSKQSKAARVFAKMAGVDWKRNKREQRINKFIKNSPYWDD